MTGKIGLFCQLLVWCGVYFGAGGDFGGLNLPCFSPSSISFPSRNLFFSSPSAMVCGRGDWLQDPDGARIPVGYLRAEWQLPQVEAQAEVVLGQERSVKKVKCFVQMAHHQKETVKISGRAPAQSLQPHQR